MSVYKMLQAWVIKRDTYNCHYILPFFTIFWVSVLPIQLKNNAYHQSVLGTSINDISRFWPFLTYQPTFYFRLWGLSWTLLPTLISDVINGRSLWLLVKKLAWSMNDTKTNIGMIALHHRVFFQTFFTCKKLKNIPTIWLLQKKLNLV